MRATRFPVPPLQSLGRLGLRHRFLPFQETGTCEHVFVTAHGSAYTRFRRALATGDPLIVRAAAAELPRISLGDALAVCLVMAEREPDSFPRYAVRWHGRLCAEAKGLTAEEAQLALAAALSLLGPGRPAGLEALSRLCERHGFTDAADVLDRWVGG